MPGPLPKYAITLTAEQVARLMQLSTSHTAPYAEVQRARVILLANQHPAWRNAEIAREVGCCAGTVQRWRRRWHSTDCLHDAPRAGRRRTFTPLARAQTIAPACSPPREPGKSWARWSGDKLAEAAVAQQIVPSISEEVNFSREASDALIERLENDALTTDDRCVLAKLITLHFSQIREDALDREITLTPTAGVASSKRANHKKAMRNEEVRPATKALIEILHHKPNVYGINRSNWSHQSLADAYEQQYGQRMSIATVHRLLKEAGYSWKKSRKVLTSPDPHYREKVELLLRTLQSLQVDELFFFIDELGPVQVKRHGGRCYTPKGEVPTHPQIQHSKGSITLYGALSATTNQVTWFYGETKDSTAMIDLVEILFNQYHDKSRIYITWDAASWHRSHELVEWVDDFNTRNKANGPAPLIDLVPLPSSAQFLDVIEAVFSGMKRAVIHYSDYQSEEEMKSAISRHFKERNAFFKHNPRRAGKKIWQVDFFEDYNNLRSGNYREW
jgi:transposase